MPYFREVQRAEDVVRSGAERPEKHTSWLSFGDSGVWIRLAGALPNAVAALLILGRLGQILLPGSIALVAAVGECSRTARACAGTGVRRRGWLMVHLVGCGDCLRRRMVSEVGIQARIGRGAAAGCVAVNRDRLGRIVDIIISAWLLRLCWER